ncbi:hypothetical protein [Pedobacter nutrimenti]|jgi:hypothetical protein|uniref:Uncharacterized protein n=1 Tax=Pedobacter nutrimenti TaxID=1241337 RepID=A0A318UCE3_9SPHI|nr:hypothetical protein [Pedobacter nutrimenti]PYF74102.1 hypothetical protein B0O44_104273 [Pedobacter nutrimenti]
MKKTIDDSINHFNWLIYVTGHTKIPYLVDPAVEIDRAYKTFTDLIFTDILNDPEKAKKDCEALRKELITLMDAATEIIGTLKNSDNLRCGTAVLIYNKLCVILDFLDDFQQQPA